MKRCPNCQRTFDDNMRFCQTDGTPLVADEAPADPYKTMVASKEDIAAALRSTSDPAPVQSAPENVQPAREDEPLQIPSEPIPGATPASELKTRIAQPADEGQVIEIPPIGEETPSSIPSFAGPSSTPPPSFGDSLAPPSPFSAADDRPSSGAGDFPTTPPIPSPFSGQKPPSFEAPPSEPQVSEPEPSYSEPEPAKYEPDPEPSTPQFAEPERREPSPAFDPFQPQAAAPGASAMSQSDWTPPPSPASSSQNQPGGKSMQSPPPAAAGQNKTLAIISLVVGILSLCCGYTFVPGLIAIVLGFMARGKANSDPMHYGGSGLAVGGIITGAFSLILGVILIALYFLGFAASLMSR
jgi:hypothetical protein